MRWSACTSRAIAGTVEPLERISSSATVAKASSELCIGLHNFAAYGSTRVCGAPPEGKSRWLVMWQTRRRDAVTKIPAKCPIRSFKAILFECRYLASVLLIFRRERRDILRIINRNKKRLQRENRKERGRGKRDSRSRKKEKRRRKEQWVSKRKARGREEEESWERVARAFSARILCDSYNTSPLAESLYAAAARDFQISRQWISCRCKFNRRCRSPQKKPKCVPE